MKHIANALAAHGRGPDDSLVHMSKGEIQSLARLGGLRSLPINPKTGLPEAGLLSTILPMAAMFLGPAGVPLWALGAAGGAVGSALEGGNMLRGGLMGGVMGAMAPGVQEAAPISESATQAVGSNMAGTVGEAGTNLAQQGVAQAANPFSSGAMAPESASFAAPALQSAPSGVGTLANQAGGAPTADFVHNLSDFSSPTFRPNAAISPMDASRQLMADPRNAGISQGILDQQANAMAKASNPGIMQQFGNFAFDNPKTTAAGIGALGYGLKSMMPKPVTAPMHSVHMAGPASSTRELNPNAVYATEANYNPVTAREQNYFQPNSPGNYTSAPGYDVMRYDTGGMIQSGDLFDAPLMPGHQTDHMANAIQNQQQFAAGGPVDTSKEGWYNALAAQTSAANPGDAAYATGYAAHITPAFNSIGTLGLGYGSGIQEPMFAPKAQRMFARGGILNLRPHPQHMNPMFIRGAGDGMSDSIPASIDGQGQRPNEPIRVANNEFIVPADAVAHIGNGSSDAGAEKLHTMISKVRKAKTGKTKQPAAMNTTKMMPA